MILYLEESLSILMEQISTCTSPIGASLMFFALALLIIGTIFVVPALAYAFIRLALGKARLFVEKI